MNLKVKKKKWMYQLLIAPLITCLSWTRLHETMLRTGTGGEAGSNVCVCVCVCLGVRVGAPRQWL